MGVPGGQSPGILKLRLKSPFRSVTAVVKACVLVRPRVMVSGVVTGKPAPMSVTAVVAPPVVGLMVRVVVSTGGVTVRVGVTVGVSVAVAVAGGVSVGVSVGVGVCVGVSVGM
jgi:hypothetical protein